MAVDSLISVYTNALASPPDETQPADDKPEFIVRSLPDNSVSTKFGYFSLWMNGKLLCTIRFIGDSWKIAGLQKTQMKACGFASREEVEDATREFRGKLPPPGE